MNCNSQATKATEQELKSYNVQLVGFKPVIWKGNTLSQSQEPASLVTLALFETHSKSQ